MNFSQEIDALFERDLKRLQVELDMYDHEDKLWIIHGEINNSAGNLMMHICGNLQHFVGAVLNDSKYERNRDFEFSGKLSKGEILEQIKKTKEVVATSLSHIPADELSAPYPLQPFGYPMTKSQFLMHLYGHLNYHLGQVNYHRRLLEL